TYGPGFSVAVHDDIGKCGARGRVKQLLTERHLGEHIGRSLLRRRVASLSLSVLRRGLGPNPSLIDAGAFPELTGDLDAIDASLLPPGFFVAGAMHRAVMRAAERDGKFIAC